MIEDHLPNAIEGHDGDALAAEAQLAAVAKALAHPARVRIVRLLSDRGGCVCGEIVDELPLAQATVSQHLKVLKDAGLLRASADGVRVGYCLQSDALERLAAAVTALQPAVPACLPTSTLTKDST